jgi:hypothetical protein
MVAIFNHQHFLKCSRGYIEKISLGKEVISILKIYKELVFKLNLGLLQATQDNRKIQSESWVSVLTAIHRNCTTLSKFSKL